VSFSQPFIKNSAIVIKALSFLEDNQENKTPTTNTKKALQS
jgi:hypothetical protein